MKPKTFVQLLIFIPLFFFFSCKKSDPSEPASRNSISKGNHLSQGMNDTLAKLKREKGVITRVLNAEEVDKLKATGEFSLLPTVSLKKYVEEAYKIDSTKGFSYAYMKNGSLFYARVARFTLSQKNHSKNYLEFNAKGIKSSDVYQERCYDIFNYTSAYGIDADGNVIEGTQYTSVTYGGSTCEGFTPLPAIYSQTNISPITGGGVVNATLQNQSLNSFLDAGPSDEAAGYYADTYNPSYQYLDRFCPCCQPSTYHVVDVQGDIPLNINISAHAQLNMSFTYNVDTKKLLQPNTASVKTYATGMMLQAPVWVQQSNPRFTYYSGRMQVQVVGTFSYTLRSPLGDVLNSVVPVVLTALIDPCSGLGDLSVAKRY